METPSPTNFVPCIRWVRRGVAKSNPDRIELSKEELNEIIRHSQAEIISAQEDIDSEEDQGAQVEEDGGDPMKKYKFDEYDIEKGEHTGLQIGGLAVLGNDSEDNYVELNEEEEDSEKEDETIQPSDNLLVVGHVEGDASILEVYVYNHEEGSFYVHHDLILPSIPLCLEWLNHDASEHKPGNLMAVGSLEPTIDLWDLDLMNCLEPVTQLGVKGSRRKGIPHVGHRDAVLDLAWNESFSHILASGSVDQTVLLWDLDEGIVATKLSPFKEKVQTLEWHPFEAQTLLTGCCDQLARVFDCRTENSFKSWSVGGEVERVVWDQFNPFSFLASTNTGNVYRIDCRTDKPLWQLAAHEKEVTGLALSSECPGLLITTGNEGILKVWDVEEMAQPTFIHERKMEMGALQCLDANPNVPFVFAFGGDNRSSNLKVINVVEWSCVADRFGQRVLVRPVKIEPETLGSHSEHDETMDTAATAADAMESLAIAGTSTETGKQLKTFLKKKHLKKRKK